MVAVMVMVVMETLLHFHHHKVIPVVTLTPVAVVLAQQVPMALVVLVVMDSHHLFQEVL